MGGRCGAMQASPPYIPFTDGTVGRGLDPSYAVCNDGNIYHLLHNKKSYVGGGVPDAPDGGWVIARGGVKTPPYEPTSIPPSRLRRATFHYTREAFTLHPLARHRPAWPGVAERCKHRPRQTAAHLVVGANIVRPQTWK